MRISVFFLTFALLTGGAVSARGNDRLIEMLRPTKPPESIADLMANSAPVVRVTVEISSTNPEHKALWVMPRPLVPILFERLEELPKQPVPDPDGLEAAHPDKAYEGLAVMFEDMDGRFHGPLHFFDGKIYVPGGAVIRHDPERRLEYWVFGTSENNNIRQISTRVLPIYSFDQCLELNNRIIYTDPRQCYLINGTLLLDVMEKPTPDTLNIRDFETCLEKGEALIDTFPRRCVAAGGRVFVEPPRLQDILPRPPKARTFTPEDFGMRQNSGQISPSEQVGEE